MYKVNYEGETEKFIKKLDKIIRYRLLRKISLLADNPFPRNPKHVIYVIKNKYLCELSVDKIRVYYTINKDEVLIDEIFYDGLVNVNEIFTNHKSGNKINSPNQRKDITKIKKKFKDKFHKK